MIRIMASRMKAATERAQRSKSRVMRRKWLEMADPGQGTLDGPAFEDDLEARNLVGACRFLDVI